MASPTNRSASAPACSRILFKDEVVSTKICAICEKVCTFGNFIFSSFSAHEKRKEYICSKECMEIQIYERNFVNSLKASKEKAEAEAAEKAAKKVDVAAVALSPRKSVSLDIPINISDEAKKIIRRQATPFVKGQT